MNEIDDVLSESMRRRAAEARLGGGSMVDVQRRVVRRRRRLASVASAMLVLPALVGLGVVIGQHSTRSNISAAASNDAAPPAAAAVASSDAPCSLSLPVGVTPAPCATSNGLAMSCAVGGGSGMVGLGAPDVERLDVAPPDPATAPTAPSGTVVPDTAPATTVPPATGPMNTYPVIVPMPVECPIGACASGVMSLPTQPAEVGASGSGTAPDGATGDATTVPPAAGFTTPADPVVIAPGSVPPDAGTNVVATTGTTVSVASPGDCAGHTSWTCTGEITTPSTQPGWRDFTQCEPVFPTVDGTTTIESGTVVVVTPTP
ncbi:unannotated protein [freshwater metagenome]|uniref:Unannotated protein n=1 Tax=freshwater metagenome TaxID=449393 RepID=A0A6J7EUD1_9ZZZZ|nr:hypothetical protein [Actinomycetota bacterium]